MSDKPDTATTQGENNFFKERWNLLLCFTWIGSIFLIGALLWFSTQNYRIRLLTETVNRALAKNGGRERIGQRPLFSGGPVSVMGGFWFAEIDTSLESGSAGKVFVFTIMRGGIAAVCVALTDSNGKVKTILPLGGNAEQVLEELPLPIYRFYAERIEQDAHRRMGGKKN